MDFNIDDDYFLYIEDTAGKSVIRLQRDYEWSPELIDGVNYSLGTLFSNLEIEEIVDSLSKVYDRVELIDECEIDNYLED